MPTLKSRFHGTTSAFCSVTVEEIVRGETREEKMFVVETLDQESRREAERKGREERKQRQQAIVLSLLVVRLPAVTSPLFTPTPESNSLAAFLYLVTSISIVQLIRTLLWRAPLKGPLYLNVAPPPLPSNVSINYFFRS